MKGTEQLLNQAFALARRARDPVPSELPFGMETAILAQFRSSRASSKTDVGILRVFRWAAILACVVAVAPVSRQRANGVRCWLKQSPG